MHKIRKSVLDALSAAGYPGKLETMDSGLTSIAVKISGLDSNIDFWDCANDRTDCSTLLFTVGLDLPDGTTLSMKPMNGTASKLLVASG